MQISAGVKQSAVVITDEDGKALPNEAAQSLYSALRITCTIIEVEKSAVQFDRTFIETDLFGFHA